MSAVKRWWMFKIGWVIAASFTSNSLRKEYVASDRVCTKGPILGSTLKTSYDYSQGEAEIG